MCASDRSFSNGRATQARGGVACDRASFATVGANGARRRVQPVYPGKQSACKETPAHAAERVSIDRVAIGERDGRGIEDCVAQPA